MALPTSESTSHPIDLVKKYWFLVLFVFSIVAAVMKMEHDSTASVKEVDSLRQEHSQAIQVLQTGLQHTIEIQAQFQDKMFGRMDHLHDQLDSVKTDLTYLRAQQELRTKH